MTKQWQFRQGGPKAPSNPNPGPSLDWRKCGGKVSRSERSGLEVGEELSGAILPVGKRGRPCRALGSPFGGYKEVKIPHLSSQDMHDVDAVIDIMRDPEFVTNGRLFFPLTTEPHVACIKPSLLAKMHVAEPL